MTLGNKCPISLRKTLRLLLAAAAMPVGAYAQTTITFQQGTASYLGGVDRNLTATTAAANVALGEVVMNNGTIGESQYFLKYDSLFGTGATFIPTNATVLSATLTLKVGATTGDNAAATSAGITVAPMLADFTNATSLVSFSGVSAVGITLLTNGPLYVNGLTKLPTAITSPATLSTSYSANVTQAVQAGLLVPTRIMASSSSPRSPISCVSTAMRPRRWPIARFFR